MPGKSLKEQLLMISVYALFIIGGINFLTFGMRLSDERTYHILGAYYFDELTKGSLAGLLIMVVICIIWIFKNEEYFTRGTMSIYVMKRLDEKAPVHKRALAAPVLEGVYPACFILDGIVSCLLIGNTKFSCCFSIIMVMCNAILNDLHPFIKGGLSSFGHDSGSSCSGSFQLLMTIIPLYPVMQLTSRSDSITLTDFLLGTSATEIILNCLFFQFF